jgi:hypothetical protein
MIKITPRQLMKEIKELEPKNIIDYIFKGSGLYQWGIKNKLISKQSIFKRHIK